MTFIQKFLLSFALLGLITSAVACNEESTAHNDILDCFIERYEPLDKQLNQLYKQKMATLSTKERIHLRQSQRKWLKNKEETCVVNETLYGRESHFEAMQCDIDITKERIKFLEK